MEQTIESRPIKSKTTKSKTMDMTQGNIIKLLIQFSIPLIIGNLFQMTYNAVDSAVVGNFVSKEALAAIGSTTVIANMLVFFFNGVSIGAGVVVSRFYGAKDEKNLHTAIETAMAITFISGVFLTIFGIMIVPFMLRFMSTPEDVMAPATTYLTIYIGGLSGLMIYNIGSGILRAVGDTTRPLLFLIFTSIMNIFLDLLFVIVFHGGIAGVALATIISQFLSAIGVMLVLLKTKDVYYFRFQDLTIDFPILKDILLIGLPTGLQGIVTAFSNVFVQSYINFFGSPCMAGWGCYNKLDMFIMLPMQSLSQAATTFVGQNVGAKQYDRVNKGTVHSLALIVAITAFISTILFVFATPAIWIFSKDPEVIEYGTMFVRTNVYFLIFNSINHTLAGALRGRGDSTGPMFIMLFSFVALRQIYLYIMANFISNTARLIGFGYPVGWTICCILETAYFYFRFVKRKDDLV